MLTATNDWSTGAMPEVEPGSERRPRSLDRLAVVLELLGALDEATEAGREHLMDRTIEVLRGEVLAPGLRLTPLQMATLLVLLADLDHEAARAAPSLATFRDRARGVVEMLAAGGRPGRTP